MPQPSTLSSTSLPLKNQSPGKVSRFQRLKEIYIRDIKPCIATKTNLDEEYNFTSGTRRGCAPEYPRTPSSSRKNRASLGTSVMSAKR
jgi:ArsR family metal-binding transcriptional regulator